MPDNELVAAYKSIPIVTRTLLTATILISFGIAVHAISYYSVMLDFQAILYRFHVGLFYFRVQSMSRQKKTSIKV